MKPLKLSIILTFVIAVSLCIGLVAALDQNEATVQTVGLPEAVQAGQTIQVRLFFTSTSTDQLQISAVSVHFDWMPTGTVAGYHLPTPVTIQAGGGSYLFEPISIAVPASATNGQHTYFAGIDGVEGSTTFSWDSPTATITVTGGSNSTAPTPTPASGGQPGAQTDLLLYGAIAAIVIVVGLLIVLVVLKRRRSKPTSVTKPAAGQPEPHQPPADQGGKPEQSDFNI